MGTPTSHSIGESFENRWSNQVGGRVQSQSGAGKWARLDVLNMGGRRILWSCKSTGKASYTLSRYDLKEPIDAVYGPNGIGGDTIPAMAVELDDLTIVIQRAEDWLEMVQSDNKPQIPTTKAQERRRQADTPPAFR